ALAGHDVYCIAGGLHLDSRFGRGGLVSPDEGTRAEARRITREAAEFAGSLGANLIIWPGIEGYNYPFQTPYADSWRWLIEGYGDGDERLGFDLYPYTEDQVAAVRRSVMQWRFIDSVAGRIDDGALREAQQAKDAVRAYEIVYAALGA